ncbi:hypothetical protein EK21DRAFT_33987, partial [Setomelanomma holmii]
FLEDCIAKKRSFQDIYESLGLYSESADARKEPVFAKEEANDLHKKVKEIANSFKALYRTGREKLRADLLEEGTFATELQELGASYGQKLWGRADKWPTRYTVQQGSEFHWDDESNQNEILFYIRCWITRYAVQTMVPRKGKANASAIYHDLSDESSDVENRKSPPRLLAAASSDLPFRRSEAPTVVPTNDTSGTESDAHSRLAKRKSLDAASESEIRSANDTRQASPTPVFPVRLMGLGRCGQREDTTDTDRTWLPPRANTVETETVIDPDEVMQNTDDILRSDSQIMDEGSAFRAIRSPTAGPSGTLPDLQRQDSVIPPSTQNDEGIRETSPPSHRNTHNQINTSMTNIYKGISNLHTWQEKQLRIELFKLLLSFLNGIEPFNPTAHDAEAETRMNSLLFHFWTNDANTLRAKVGENFTRLGLALERWMNMRHLMSEFRRASGYHGKPGPEWKEHLRQLDRVAHAKASISYVELSGFASGG